MKKRFFETPSESEELSNRLFLASRRFDLSLSLDIDNNNNRRKLSFSFLFRMKTEPEKISSDNFSVEEKQRNELFAAFLFFAFITGKNSFSHLLALNDTQWKSVEVSRYPILEKAPASD